MKDSEVRPVLYIPGGERNQASSSEQLEAEESAFGKLDQFHHELSDVADPFRIALQTKAYLLDRDGKAEKVWPWGKSRIAKWGFEQGDIQYKFVLGFKSDRDHTIDVNRLYFSLRNTRREGTSPLRVNLFYNDQSFQKILLDWQFDLSSDIPDALAEWVPEDRKYVSKDSALVEFMEEFCLPADKPNQEYDEYNWKKKTPRIVIDLSRQPSIGLSLRRVGYPNSNVGFRFEYDPSADQLRRVASKDKILT